MIQRILALLLIVTGVSISSTSSASFLIEPSVGYAFGSQNSSDYSGSTIGGRLGFSSLGLWGSVDYTMNTLKSTSATTSPTDIALTVGYDFPLMIRAYAGYLVNTKYTSGSSDVTGTGMKFGVGFTMFPLISINLESVGRTYTRWGSVDLTNSYKMPTTGISISLPINL